MKARMTVDTIRIEVQLPVPPERAWALLAEKRHRANWWGDYVQLEARPGGRLVETWSDGARQVVTSGEVTCCEPPMALEMRWADDDWPGATHVAFHLSAQHGGTRLVLEHSGWAVHPAGTRRKLIDAHAAGWSQHLERLAEYASEAGP